MAMPSGVAAIRERSATPSRWAANSAKSCGAAPANTQLTTPSCRATGPPAGGPCGPSLSLQHPTALQVGKFTGVNAEPILQYLGTVAAQRRRRLQPHRLAVDAHRPGRHLVVA